MRPLHSNRLLSATCKMVTCGHTARVQPSFWSASINCIHMDVDSIKVLFRDISAGSSARDKSVCYCQTLSSNHLRNVTSTYVMHHLNAIVHQQLPNNCRPLCLKDFCQFHSVLFLFTYTLCTLCVFVCSFVCLCGVVREWEVLNDRVSWISRQSVQRKLKKSA